MVIFACLFMNEKISNFGGVKTQYLIIAFVLEFRILAFSVEAAEAQIRQSSYPKN